MPKVWRIQSISTMGSKLVIPSNWVINILKLLGLEYLDTDNTLHPVIMGSYGIGPGRCLAAIVEQNHDDFGILWPKALAPYSVAIVVINTKIELQSATGETLYQQLTQAGIDVLLDDRDERAGVKFNDMDLIGIPLRITIGKTIDQGKVEVKARNQKDIQLLDLDQVLPYIQDFLK